MLQTLRDSMKYLAWILWAVIAVFVLFVFVDFGGGVGPGTQTARPAVTVGDQEISWRDYERQYRQIEDEMQQQLGPQFSRELAEQLRLPMQAITRLVNREVLLAEADRLDLRVTDEDLRSYIVTLPMLQDGQGKFVGPEIYERAVRQLGFTPQTFETEMRNQLRLQRLVGAFERAVLVSEPQVDERYRQQVERARLRYVALPFGALAGEVQLGDADLQAWFSAHQENYRIPEQRVADYLLIDPVALQATLQLSDADLQAYYQEHTAEFAEEEQVRARHVLVDTPELAAEAQRRVAAGEDFAAVAAAMSKEPGAAERGGDLGWFGRGRMVPEFEQAVWSAPVGQVVGPVQTQFGYHLIKVEERRPSRTPPLDQVRDAVRARLAGERAASAAEERAATLATELKQAGATAKQKMLEAGSQPGVQLGITEPFQAQGLVAPLGMAPAVNAAAFSLPQGGVSDPLRTQRGWVVLRLEEVRAPRVPALAEVADRVRGDVEQDRLRQLALSRLQAARQRVEAGASLDEVAVELGVSVQESDEFGHGQMVPGLGPAPELVTAALAAGEGTLGGPLAIPGRAVLYRVSERRSGDAATMVAVKKGIREDLEREQVNALLAALINARKQELGVTYDPALVEQLGLTPGAGNQG